jgi:putative addiction module component (TIGR02574 family)
MTKKTEKVLSKALELSPIERAELVEQILSSFEFVSRKSMDELWAREAEERIDAYDAGKIKSSPADDVFKKIGRE